MINLLYSIWGIRKILLIIENFIVNVRFSRRFGNSVTVYGLPIIILAKQSSVKCGKNFTIISTAFFSEPGINHPTIIRTINNNAKIQIGDNVGISGGGIISATEVNIGNEVMIGANSLIMDTDFHPVDPINRRYNRENVKSSPIVIHDNVFIGMNSIVMKGVTIGKNSVIGSGSIVTKDIPENCIAAGIPAKVIKNID